MPFVWNMNPVLLQWGDLELRWYGLFFATGLLLSASACPKYFEIWGIPRAQAERLSLWLPVGMLIGAHYIHMIFYETENLFDFRFRINSLIPLDLDVGRFWALGSGLASHGGGLGTFLALLIFWRRNGKPIGISFHRYLDALMVTATWVFGWVRLGNFFNSEIVGRVTTFPTAVRFPLNEPQTWQDCASCVDCLPLPMSAGVASQAQRLNWDSVCVAVADVPARHPQQLYEAIGCFAVLGLALFLQKKFANRWRTGALFYTVLGSYFLMRFLAEFTKEEQVHGAEDILTMGQWLSLPVLLLCVFMIFFTKRFNILKPLTADEQKAIDGELAHARAQSMLIDSATPSESSKPVRKEPKKPKRK